LDVRGKQRPDFAEFGFVWYGQGTPSTSATLVLTTGQSVCGSIATTDLTKNSGEIMFTNNGTTRPYRVNEIAQINVGTC
jgi:hypothetical protein